MNVKRMASLMHAKLEGLKMEPKFFLSYGSFRCEFGNNILGKNAFIIGESTILQPDEPNEL